jgi:hypothetical protein
MIRRFVPLLALAIGSTTLPVAAQVDYRAIAAAHQGSLTGARLRSDVTANLRQNIGAMDACPRVSVLSMRVISFTNGRAPWRERWIVADCKKTRPVTLTFTPTSDGGADFAISLRR